MTTTELLLDVPDPYFVHTRGYHLRVATCQADVLAAQRLRAEVLHTEVVRAEILRAGSARSGALRGWEPDAFDDRCDHLIVWYYDGFGSRRAVACGRLLPAHANDACPRAVGLSADAGFGLMPLEQILDSTVELSRVAVHQDHRTGIAVSILCGGVARYLQLTGHRYLLGSVPTGVLDGGRRAAAIWDLTLAGGHLASAERRCRPRIPIPIGGLVRTDRPALPPLLRGLLRLGGKVCGPPARGEMPGTADFLVLLDLDAADEGNRRRYLPRSG